ncbi:MAG: hypothetical protein HWQ42_23050 [Nostoc sp. JL23]|uniref:hypothetical protein n=1 Tax=Nostoc sp. TaxID=1180 RepID=UPI001D9456D5|nr:hypothetical protein [Nostoc sp. JL23]
MSNFRKHQLRQSNNLIVADYAQSDRGSIPQMFYAWSDKAACPSILSALSLPQKTPVPHGALGKEDRAVFPLSTLELQQQ